MKQIIKTTITIKINLLFKDNNMLSYLKTVKL